MIRKSYLGIVFALVFSGCGGGVTNSVANETSASTPNVTETNTSTPNITAIDNNTSLNFITPSEINLTKAIQDGDIIGYDSDDSIEDQYLAVINYFRSLNVKCNDSKAYEGPVGSDIQWNILLENSSKEHSEDMRIAEHYAHGGSGTVSDITGQTFDPPRPSTPFERMNYHEYDYSNASENIALTVKYPTLEGNAWITTMEAWMTSTDGHCSNIMDPDFTDFGMYESRGVRDFTFSDGVTRTSQVAYWTQNFGKPQ